jgi:tyrosine-protein phosphatase YwqE
VLNWFKLKEQPSSDVDPIVVDIHSHLLPNLDDGVESFEQAAEIITTFIELGYTKLITTPHVMSDAYRNTSEGILSRLEELKSYLKEQQIYITLEAAAEYYLDEDLVNKLNSNEPLLTFGKNLLLFETNFLSEPLILKEFIFLANTKGYQPVLAHPERYVYLQNNFQKAQDFLDRGVYFQININSISGHYSKGIQQTVLKLIDKGMVHLLGSDCHHLQHIHLVREARKLKAYRKALSLPLLNNTL